MIYVHNELHFYLSEVYLCDPECEALDVYLYDPECKDPDSVWTYKVFPLILLDVIRVVPAQGSISLPPNESWSRVVVWPTHRGLYSGYLLLGVDCYCVWWFDSFIRAYKAYSVAPLTFGGGLIALVEHAKHLRHHPWISVKEWALLSDVQSVYGGTPNFMWGIDIFIWNFKVSPRKPLDVDENWLLYLDVQSVVGNTAGFHWQYIALFGRTKRL